MGKMKELDYMLKGFSKESQKDFNKILYGKKSKIRLTDGEEIKFLKTELDGFYDLFFE